MLRVGIDLCKAATVEDAVAEHGQRYLDRLYSDAEQEQCKGDSLKLAARFAAKEATMKVLAPDPDDAVPWPSIEVVRNAPTAPSLRLHGAAAALAERAGLSDFQVSFTHEDEYAAAVVVGT
jgi:holo-[acyl-carrier protein] synthase